MYKQDDNTGLYSYFEEGKEEPLFTTKDIGLIVQLNSKGFQEIIRHGPGPRMEVIIAQIRQTGQKVSAVISSGLDVKDLNKKTYGIAPDT